MFLWNCPHKKRVHEKFIIILYRRISAPGAYFKSILEAGWGGGGGGGVYQGGGGDLIPKLMEKAMIKRMAMLNDFTINPLMHMPQNGQKHFNNLAAFILWIEEYF